MHSPLRSYNVCRSLTVLACVILVGTGCRNEATITGQLTFTDGSPMVDHPVIFWPNCRVPRMHPRGGGWTGGYDGEVLKSSRVGNRVIKPTGQTDEEGRFALTVDKGWLKRVCPETAICESRRSDMKEANVKCRTDGYTLAISGLGIGEVALWELNTAFGDTPWPYPIDDEMVDLGVLEVGWGWLISDKYLPDNVDRTGFFGMETRFHDKCRWCHGPEGTGGPDTSPGRYLALDRRTAGPDLTDDEWIHSDGTYEGIMESLKGEACDRSIIRLSLLRREEYIRQEGREDWDLRGAEVRYPDLERMAAYVHALQYRPRSGPARLGIGERRPKATGPSE